VIGQAQASRAHGYDLSMGRGVVLADIAICAIREKLAIGSDQHRTNRYFIILALGAIGLRQRATHPVQIGGRKHGNNRAGVSFADAGQA